MLLIDVRDLPGFLPCPRERTTVPAFAGEDETRVIAPETQYVHFDVVFVGLFVSC